MVRLPGCDGGGETTVLAHYRMLPFNGTGIKPPDWMGAWCCHHCHDCCDFRRQPNAPIGTGVYTRDEIRLAHLEGVIRTLAKLNEMGELDLSNRAGRERSRSARGGAKRE